MHSSAAVQQQQYSSISTAAAVQQQQYSSSKQYSRAVNPFNPGMGEEKQKVFDVARERGEEIQIIRFLAKEAYTYDTGLRRQPDRTHSFLEYISAEFR